MSNIRISYQSQGYVAVLTEPPILNKYNIVRKKIATRCFGLVTTILFIGCILAIILHHVNSSASRTSESLRFVIVVTRHGARAPLKLYPNDPYSNITEYWPEGFGGLTKIGKQQMYNLGQMLRNSYDGFLNEHYMSKEFMVQSTVEERTYMSAATLLAGLYPPKTYQIWNPDIHWQPIPIHSTDLDKYNVALKPHLCPAYWKELNNSLNSFSVEENYQTLLETLKMHAGTDNSGLHMFYIWDTLTCEYWNDMKLPEWTQGIYPDKMIEPVIALYKTFAVSTRTMTRLVVGSLLNSIVHHMSDKVNDTLRPDRKMFYHSGHDMTLLGLQTALGIKDTGIVNPASSLLLELHHGEEGKYYVKMLLIKGTKSTPEPVETEIPSCKSPCDFGNFISGVSEYLVTDWNEECQMSR